MRASVVGMMGISVQQLMGARMHYCPSILSPAHLVELLRRRLSCRWLANFDACLVMRNVNDSFPCTCYQSWPRS